MKNRIVTADGSVQTEKTVQSSDSFWPLQGHENTDQDSDVSPVMFPSSI